MKGDRTFPHSRFSCQNEETLIFLLQPSLNFLKDSLSTCEALGESFDITVKSDRFYLGCNGSSHRFLL
jgi:hypothetical protein